MASGQKKFECLVIGANGLIGRQLARALAKNNFTWKGADKNRAEGEMLGLDITDPISVKNIFSRVSPRAVFHCAGLAGGVNFCESHPEIAADFHLNATKEIVNHCKESGAELTFMSTDYIFDGTKTSYKEKDEPNPLNIYGALKLESEKWIQKNLKSYLIIRTTNVYGWDPETTTPNYIMNLYRTLKEGRCFNAPSFLWGTPTYVGDLAEAIVELYKKKATGTYHVVGSSFINRLEWAKKASTVLGLDASLIDESSQPVHDKVRRPSRMCLSTDKFINSYTTRLHDVAEGQKLMKLDMEGSKTFSLKS